MYVYYILRNFKVSYFVYQIKFEIIKYQKRYPATCRTEDGLHGIIMECKELSPQLISNKHLIMITVFVFYYR